MNQPPSLTNVQHLATNWREAVEDIKAIETQLATLSGDREDLIESGREDDITVNRLSQLDARAALATSRLQKAAIHAAEAEKRTGEAAGHLADEIIIWMVWLLSDKQKAFEKSIEPFFESGARNKFFVGSANISADKAMSKQWFAITDTATMNLQRRQNVSRAASESLPLERRLRILEEFFASI